MIFPILFLLILIYIALNSSIINCLFPFKAAISDQPSQLYNNGITYVETTSGTLHYTGYDYFKGSTTKAHYFYSLENGKCTIYVFSTDFFTNGFQSTIENATFEAELIPASDNYKQLLTLMANDMNWTYEGLAACTDPIIISQMNYALVPSILLGIFIYFSFAFSFGHLLILIFNIIKPQYAYTFVALGHHKTRKMIILSAAEELENCVHFHQENMYVTTHYFLYISNYNIAIIPLDSMAWAYKYSRLHKYYLFGEMTYTMKIITKQKIPYLFHRKTKKAADELLAYLKKTNVNMLIGYTQENYESSKHIMKSILSYFLK